MLLRARNRCAQPVCFTSAHGCSRIDEGASFFALEVSMKPLLVIALVAAAAGADAGKLGIGLRGLGKVDPKVTQLEMDLLRAGNILRKGRRLAPLPMDESLRRLVRQQAELGARGDPAADSFDARVKNGKLAPHGYRVQYVFGTNAKEIFAKLEKVPEAVKALTAEHARIGIGAFLVPVARPYFQVALIVAGEPDPRAGLPGLSREQTDPLMAQAATTIKSVCYDKELRANPNFSGNLIFQLVIGDRGQVTAAKLLSGTTRERFNDCALRVIGEVAFPAPYKGKPVTLNHPMRFVPPQGRERVGRLSPAQVANVFRTIQQPIKACYDPRVKEQPGLHGTLELALRVEPDGLVGAVRVLEDGPGDAQLTRCVLGHVRRLRFPRPEFDGAAQVVFPLRFSPPSLAR
jgi:outer membrane biosynthesis protein TonB